jgi:hypothetical protein
MKPKFKAKPLFVVALISLLLVDTFLAFRIRFKACEKNTDDYGGYNDTMTLSYNPDGTPAKTTTRGKWRCKHCTSSKCRKRWCRGESSDKYWRQRLPFLAVRVPALPIGSKLGLISLDGVIYYCSEWWNGGCKLYLTGTPSKGWPKYMAELRVKWPQLNASLKLGWKRWKRSNKRWKLRLPKLAIRVPSMPRSGTSTDNLISIVGFGIYYCREWNSGGFCTKYLKSTPNIGWFAYTRGLKKGWRFLLHEMSKFDKKYKRGKNGKFRLRFPKFRFRGFRRGRGRRRGRKRNNRIRIGGKIGFKSPRIRLNVGLDDVFWDLRLPKLAIRVTKLPHRSTLGIVLFDSRLWHCSEWGASNMCFKYSPGRPSQGWNAYIVDYRKRFGLDISQQAFAKVKVKRRHLGKVRYKGKHRLCKKDSKIDPHKLKKNHRLVTICYDNTGSPHMMSDYMYQQQMMANPYSIYMNQIMEQQRMQQLQEQAEQMQREQMQLQQFKQMKHLQRLMNKDPTYAMMVMMNGGIDPMAPGTTPFHEHHRPAYHGDPHFIHNHLNTNNDPVTPIVNSLLAGVYSHTQPYAPITSVSSPPASDPKPFQHLAYTPQIRVPSISLIKGTTNQQAYRPPPLFI